MPLDASIRPATRADRDAVGALWTAFLAEQAALDPRAAPVADATRLWSATFRDLVDDGLGALLVAEQAGQVVGFVVAEPHAEPPVFEAVPEVFVGELYVAPEARRRGLARALLDAAAAWAVGQGAARVRFAVLWGNDASRRLVAAWGAAPYAVTYTKDVRRMP